jgi:predicted phage baseplate assembly protein
MVLPAPNLDDRTFQDFVDDAKRLVQQRCPEWTDHNVSDPGVTLIEAFAQMADQLVYRLNRVPERQYVKFLELIGVRLRPPAAARGQVTFWLSAPQPQTVVVRAETEVATSRTDVEDAVVFSTVEELRIVPCTRAHAGSALASGEASDETTALDFGTGFACFQPEPKVGDALLVGLSEAVPSCAVNLRIDCPVAGVGVDPRRPPLVWEAWTGSSWAPCDLDRDETGGFNRPGDVVVHVPPGHRTSVTARQRAGWLRCRVVKAGQGQPTYRASPWITGITAFTIGGTVGTIHAEVVRNEDLGSSDGTPAQRFALQRAPVVPWDTPSVLVETARDGSRQEWHEVDTFAASQAGDRHFRLDASAGEIELGPAVREADGSLHRYGAVPDKGSGMRLTGYRTGGGQRGNVARGQVRVLKSSVPYVARVENRVAAVGGAEAEGVGNAKLRGPLLLRTRGRAVTTEDFEELTREVAPDAARVACVPADEPGGVRVLVVPHLASDEIGRVRREDLDPPPLLLERISRYLDERRLIGTRLVVEPPEYRWLTAVVDVTARRGEHPDTVRDDVLLAIYRLFDPLVGGPEGTGWPFGRAVQAHEVHAALSRLPGVDMSQEATVQLFPANPQTRQRDPAAPRVALAPTALVYSFDHQVRIRS